MLDTGFPVWPRFTTEESDAVSRVLLSNRVNYWTGTEGRDFEREFAAWAGTRFAIAVSNGTVALEAALKALDIGVGDEVIVSSRTFIASASCIAMAGAQPVFADVDPDSQNITAKTVRAVMSGRTRAVICVHLGGMPCEMDPIVQLADDHGIAVIEDCAQAHGARYKQRSVGSIGAIGTWSFCQDKIMTTGGEGGMITTNSEALWSAMWSYKDHGKDWQAVHEKNHPPGFRWLHERFGTNGRMTEMQAAIGRIQLRRVDGWVATRRAYADAIWQAARAIPALRVPAVPEWMEHAAYKCYVFVDQAVLKEGWDRDRIMSEINARGVPCYSGSCSEIYLEQAFRRHGLSPEHRLPHAQTLGEESLMFLVHPTLAEQHIAETCVALADVMRVAAEPGPA